MQKLILWTSKKILIVYRNKFRKAFKKINLVIAVHLAGHSSDMKKYTSLKKYKFNLIEDACHALGGKFLGHKIGS